MVRVGEVTWVARVEGQGKVSAAASDLQEDMGQVAQTSEKAAAAQNEVGEATGESSDKIDSASRSTGALNTATGLLSSTLFFGAKQTGLLTVATKAYTVAAWGATAATKAWGISLGGLAAIKAGLLGGVAKLIAVGKGFVAWLAAGSAGALAFAAAIGVGLGLLGVWILETLGALDAVQRFGGWVREVLPDWVADGILMAISLVAGPLAAFGGFILGTIRGGFSEGFATARQVVDNFVGAWERNLGRAWDVISGFFGDIRSGFSDLLSDARGFAADVGDALSGKIKSGFNAVVPDSVSLPSTTLSAPSWAGGMSATIGGGSLNLPQLDVGGRIRESGVAEVHKGEAVIPEPLVDAAESGGSGGGGSGGTTTVENNYSIEIGDQSLDLSDVDRGTLRMLADLIGDELGENTGNITGA